MLEARAICKSYRGQPVLHPLSVSFEAGRTTALIGPSGCGKSTLLRILIGLVSADRGEVFVAGERFTPESARRLRHRMGYVIQEGGLFPHLSARDNVTLLASHLGWSAERMAERIATLRALVRLPEEALARFPGQLSGGQRQRVSLMRALMLDPEVLLLDEPMGALDPMIRAELQADLKEVFAALGKAVALVTHDLGEAAYLAHEILLLREGHVIQRGSFDELLKAPADTFVTRFVQAQRWPEESP
ncbi:ATP-binding cassette domain-containing protein [Chondromyces crocatus]|uniref:ABC transporter ATP-binding protein n=1 Tax=Chondromyces crocatus TaxID=52 RepID=A0A0K1E9X2_CHOCO|nr:ATP-binding cassette domain-containing protein [Chondromyces crocatus]AKT37639.1 ABC transporter ATP-binding protein [Chondromyces crocatus]